MRERGLILKGRLTLKRRLTLKEDLHSEKKENMREGREGGLERKKGRRKEGTRIVEYCSGIC